MSKLDWHFRDYPEVGLDDDPQGKKQEALHYSDDVIIKWCNGDVSRGCYCAEKQQWLDYENDEWVSWSQVVCWAYIGRIPETLAPMPAPPKFIDGKFVI